MQIILPQYAAFPDAAGANTKPEEQLLSYDPVVTALRLLETL